MGLKDTIKKDIESLDMDDLFMISEQIRLLRKKRAPRGKVRSLEEVREMTATSKSSWSEDVVRERQERG